MNVMLRTDRLAKKFGKVEALTSLTLEVPEGSVFALVGPNGAGKSTAMKVCLNLLSGIVWQPPKFWAWTLANWRRPTRAHRLHFRNPPAFPTG